MTAPLLATKLCIPPVRSGLVPRPRLIEQLNAGLHCRLTLVSAQAGSGKTTLISEWLQHLKSPGTQEGADSVDRPRGAGPTGAARASWLSLDADDNDLMRFLIYLIAALETGQSDVGADARALLQSPQPPPLNSVLGLLINSLAAVPGDFVLVLDDYHLIERQSIHDGLAFLLDHMPAQMHLVIASRVDPPLPLPRLRARGQLIELRDADLRFTPEETAAFLNQVMDLDLAASHITALETRTEGWIAGLQLAALSVQGRDDVSGFIAAFTGSNRYVLDYLVEEVLQRQPESVQTFLLQTSILDRMCGPLCDVVTGRTDGQAMLTMLERANLFTIQLDEQRRWYRYHRLFSDFLRDQVRQQSSGQLPELHRRAAQWYEQNGLTIAAVGHALQAADFEHAADLIEQADKTILMRGEMTTLMSLLEALPEDLVRSRPATCVSYAWALLGAGEFEAAEAYLLQAERGLESGACIEQGPETVPADHDLFSYVMTGQGMLAMYRGDMPGAAQLFRQAFECLPEDDPFLRGIVIWLMGSFYFEEDAEAASRIITEAVEFSRATGNLLVAVGVVYSLGWQQMMRGHLRQAEKTFSQSSQLARPDRGWGSGERDEQASPISVFGYQGLGELLRERNELEDAGRYLTRAVELGRRWGNPEVLVDGYIALARVRQAQGDAGEAVSLIREAARFVEENRVMLHTALQVNAHQARLWVMQGNLQATAKWAASREGALEPVHVEGEPMSLAVAAVEGTTLARVLIAQRHFDRTTALLESLRQATEAAGLMGFVIEILALQALAFQGQGDTPMALSTIERALSLAEPEGYVRIFVDEGEPMAELLSGFSRQRSSAVSQGSYVSQLLSALGSESPEFRSVVPRPPQPTRHPPALIEPLSEREIEVLRLVAAGLSNREIAGQLTITVGTAKRHISNIYAKLDVHSRVQAAARAQELDLL